MALASTEHFNARQTFPGNGVLNPQESSTNIPKRHIISGE
jgi:hypothetical protein